MYFGTKSYLKSKHYHTAKQTLSDKNFRIFAHFEQVMFDSYINKAELF
jgi:hypothetical protein